jgi:hypothetical protein
LHSKQTKNVQKAMKVFDEKHEAIFNVYFRPKGEKLKRGEVVPHQKKVKSVQFYVRQVINNQEVFIKQEFSPEKILEWAEIIKNIQLEFVEMPYDDIHF